MRFFPAVLLTALLGVVYWVGATFFTEKIELDITERSSAAIAQLEQNIDLDVDGRDVTLSGLVNTEQDRNTAVEVVDDVWGVRASKSLLDVRQPYHFEATHYSSEGLTVDGVVDSAEAVAHMRKSIAPVVPQGSVATNGRPMPLSGEKMALGAGSLLMLVEGELDIDEQQFILRGTAEDELIKQSVEANLNRRLDEIAPLSLVTEIAIADTMTLACREMANAAVGSNKVLFAVDSDVITDAYRDTVNTYAKLLNTCDGVVLVEAHADQDGSEDYNLKLSKRRAQAIVDAIVAQGVSTDRLPMYFYGETRPVASNETRNDKTFNRRVELQFVHQSPAAFTTLQQPIISSQSAE